MKTFSVVLAACFFVIGAQAQFSSADNAMKVSGGNRADRSAEIANNDMDNDAGAPAENAMKVSGGDRTDRSAEIANNDMDNDAGASAENAMKVSGGDRTDRSATMTKTVSANYAGALADNGRVVDAALLTGDLYADLSAVPVQDPAQQDPAVMLTAPRKHPLMAGFMSLAVPGAGEVYVGEYTKGAVFFAVEVVGIAVSILQNNKGDRRTNEFQDYADNHWSAVKYAQFLNMYAGQYRMNKDNAKIPIDLTTPGLRPWQRVDFNVINAYESEGFSYGFSHKLPKYGDQQYYELIGKYNQFKYGWDTYPVDAAGLPANDNGDYNSPPQQLLDYAANRGSANDFYSASALAISLVVVNHVLSAVDAFLSARHYNTVVSSHMSMDMQRCGDRIVAVPQLSVSVGL